MSEYLSEPAKDFLAGTFAGFAGKLLDYPMDTLKVLLQTDSTKYKNAWHCFSLTVEKKGFASLYKGISSPLLGSMAENALLFWAYNQCKGMLGETSLHELSLLELSIAGAGAGAIVPLVNTPVELVKCRLQVQSSVGGAKFASYKGPVDVVLSTIRSEGITGLYRGNLSTLYREVPGNFVYYGVYEGVCKLMIPEGGTKADLGPSAHLLGGALSGVGYWTAFYPADTVKSQIQTNTNLQGKGFLEIFWATYKEMGMRGLYRGWGVTVFRAAPAHALIFAVYEQTIKFLKPAPADDKNDPFATQKSVRD